jgi:hypothetical protein
VSICLYVCLILQHGYILLCLQWIVLFMWQIQLLAWCIESYWLSMDSLTVQLFCWQYVNTHSYSADNTSVHTVILLAIRQYTQLFCWQYNVSTHSYSADNTTSVHTGILLTIQRQYTQVFCWQYNVSTHVHCHDKYAPKSRGRCWLRYIWHVLDTFRILLVNLLRERDAASFGKWTRRFKETCLRYLQGSSSPRRHDN